MAAPRHFGRLIGKPVRVSATAVLVGLALTLACLLYAMYFGAVALQIGFALVALLLVVGLVRRGGMDRVGGGFPVEVMASSEALTFRVHPGMSAEREETLAKRSLRSGYVIPNHDGGTLVVRNAFMDRARLRFDTIAEARSLLHELGLSPLERPMTFAFFFNLRVTVGVDGVLVALPLLGRKRFVPHGAIVDIRQTSTHVILSLRNGGSYEIATGGGEQHAALVERLIEATRAYGAADHAEPLALLRQSGRSPSAWVKELRALMENAGAGYRSATIPEDTLWRVALDPSEPAEHRIGAGLALRSTLDDAGRARLRVAAEAAVAPRVRIALETAASDSDDDAVAEALERRA